MHADLNNDVHCLTAILLLLDYLKSFPMNTFKLALAIWLSFAYPLLLFASTISPSLETGNDPLSFKATACQASVEITIPVNRLCVLDTSLWQTAIDLDVQDLNEDSNFTQIDFMADLLDANAFFSTGDSSLTFAGVFSEGIHALQYDFRDTCGNRQRNLFRFQVLDTAAFTPICKAGVAVLLEPMDTLSDLDGDGEYDRAIARLYSDELLQETNFDCFGQKVPMDTRFAAIDGIGEYGLSLQNDGEEDYLFFTCSYLAWGYHSLPQLEIIATNEQGVEGRCSSYILVLDGPGSRPVCGYRESGSITVEVETFDGMWVPDVEIQFAGGLNQTRLTYGNGFQQISVPPWLDEEIEVTLERNTDPGQGVSITDMILLRRHLLGIAPLSNPWHLLAADVNNDQRTSLMDVIEMQRLILGLQDEFSNNKSWRFFESHTTFPNPSDPWSGRFYAESWVVYPHSYYIELQFIGIKIGDLNESVFSD